MPTRDKFDNQEEFECALRDYFAGQALAGYIAGEFTKDANPVWVIAEHCYNLADAMTKARDK